MAFESALVAVFIISLLSFSGASLLVLRKGLIESLLPWLVSFAAGTLLGAAFIDMLPEGVSAGEKVGIDVLPFAIIGVLVFFVVERFVYWHHHHAEEELRAAGDGGERAGPRKRERGPEVHAAAYLNIIGDGVHNFIDGVAIAAAFITDPVLGFTTTLAVAAHEIPQEISDFSILIYGGMKPRQALFWNFVSALTAVLGTLTVFLVSSLITPLVPVLLGITAGGFIYLAAVDLIPELHKEKDLRKSLLQLFMMSFGVLVIAVLVRSFKG